MSHIVPNSAKPANIEIKVLTSADYHTSVMTKSPFTLSDTESKREFFLSCFASLDVNSSVETNRTQMFATSLSQSQSLSVNGP